ncbi:MAG: hypothetical protein U9Q96_01875 [Patescibacteria group bacterium]|nr:hypothetical protein [Patescibacteria group bacterium]
MRKYIFTIALFLLGLTIAIPQSILAAAADVTFSELGYVSLTGVGSGVTLSVVAGSKVDTMVVGTSTIVLTLGAGDHIEFSCATRNRMSTTGDTFLDTCGGSASTISITSSTTLTVSTELCSSGDVGGGGGGGGGGSPAPVVEEEEEEEDLGTTAAGEGTVTASGGGTVTATTDDGSEAKVEIPADAFAEDTVIIIDPVEVTGSGVVLAVSAVPTDTGIVGDYVYDYSATVDDIAVETFEDLVTITITYTDDQISGFDESSLAIYYWDAITEEWITLSTIVDTANNTLTATTDHFTYFAVIGETSEEDDDVPVDPDDIVPISEMTATQLRARIQDIMAQLQILMTELVNLKGGATYSGIPSTFSFTRNFKLGMSSIDVKYLQIMLNASAETRVASSGVGSSGKETNYFGSLTKAAVIKFQNKYSSSVLAPVGLSRGTGFAGSSTRGKLNSLLGK